MVKQEHDNYHDFSFDVVSGFDNIIDLETKKFKMQNIGKDSCIKGSRKSSVDCPINNDQEAPFLGKRANTIESTCDEYTPSEASRKFEQEAFFLSPFGIPLDEELIPHEEEQKPSWTKVGQSFMDYLAPDITPSVRYSSSTIKQLTFPKERKFFGVYPRDAPCKYRYIRGKLTEME